MAAHHRTSRRRHAFPTAGRQPGLVGSPSPRQGRGHFLSKPLGSLPNILIVPCGGSERYGGESGA